MRRMVSAATAVALTAVVLVGVAPAEAVREACGRLVPAGMHLIRSDAAVIRGTPGADFICAGPGANVIYGLGGADHIFGRQGDDLVFAGAGADRVRGGGGNDEVRGGGGRDVLRGDHGDDLLVGGPGRDVTHGNLGVDTCLASERRFGCEKSFRLPGPVLADNFDDAAGGQLRGRLTPTGGYTWTANSSGERRALVGGGTASLGAADHAVGISAVYAGHNRLPGDDVWVSFDVTAWDGRVLVYLRHDLAGSPGHGSQSGVFAVVEPSGGRLVAVDHSRPGMGRLHELVEWTGSVRAPFALEFGAVGDRYFVAIDNRVVVDHTVDLYAAGILPPGGPDSRAFVVEHLFPRAGTRLVFDNLAVRSFG